MQTRLADDRLQELARLAHWLKGTGGTAGFPELTEVARALGRFAADGETGNARDTLATLEQMADQIVIE